jgi:anti-anti-sigma factor
MQVSVASANGRSVIRLLGRFDFNSHREFREAVESALGAGDSAEVSVDLGSVEYLDSSALGMLLMLRDKAHGAGKTVSLANCRGPVRQVLDIANFGKLFSIV